MKRNQELDKETRFSGHLRHYHRSGARPQRTWEEWIDGADAKKPNAGKWIKILIVVLSVGALAAIVGGLVVTLAGL